MRSTASKRVPAASLTALMPILGVREETSMGLLCATEVVSTLPSASVMTTKSPPKTSSPRWVRS